MAFYDNVMENGTAWSVVALARATAASVLTRNLAEAGWHLFKDDEPPQNPAARSVTWGEALTWTLATAVAVGLGRLLAHRGAAAGWKKMKGRYPEGLE